MKMTKHDMGLLFSSLVLLTGSVVFSPSLFSVGGWFGFVIVFSLGLKYTNSPDKAKFIDWMLNKSPLLHVEVDKTSTFNKVDKKVEEVVKHE